MNLTYIIPVKPTTAALLNHSATLANMSTEEYCSTLANGIAAPHITPPARNTVRPDTNDSPASTPSYRATESELLALTGHPENH